MFTLRAAKAQPEYVTYKERYKVDLPLQMAECEANYVRLSKLLTQHILISHRQSVESKLSVSKLPVSKLPVFRLSKSTFSRSKLSGSKCTEPSLLESVPPVANGRQTLAAVSNEITTSESPNEFRFMVARGAQQWLHLLCITERSPYTTTLELSRTAVGDSSGWLAMPKLTLRMYHDAKLAEVLAWEGHKRLRPRYEYPNQSMYQSDEKYQLNRFLGEWLALCLDHGHSLDAQLCFE
jgi:uncharacterized protein